MKGEQEVEVAKDTLARRLPLVVVGGSGPSLMGRNWITQLHVKLEEIHEVRQSQSYEEVLEKYPEVFEEGLGTLKGHKAKLHVDPNVQTHFCKARTVPYALRELVDNRLVEEGIRYTRLPYGVSSAPGIFQRIMEGLLKGIAGVIVYIDDILTTGKTTEQHLSALEEVLKRLVYG